MRKALISAGRRLTCGLLAVGLSVTGLSGVGSAAAATPWPYHATFSAVASGRTMSATTSITADKPVLASHLGVCATGADGTKYAFPKKDSARLSRTPVKVNTSRTLPAGVYRYYTCFVVNGKWTSAGGVKSIYVPGVAPAPVPTTVPRGDVRGWKQTFAEDFNEPVAAGRFPVGYAKKWTSYNGFPDTNRSALYDSGVISVHDGVLDEKLQRTAGVTRVAAIAPMLGKAWKGQVYGRFSVRFKADRLPGFKTAFLLWPDSNVWNQGEVDFPEAGLTETMWGYNHCPGKPTVNCTYTDTGVGFGQYHTLTIDWKPNYLAFSIDGRTVKTTTAHVPNRPMHWVLQTESTGAPVTTAGHLLIDWATVYSYVP